MMLSFFGSGSITFNININWIFNRGVYFQSVSDLLHIDWQVAYSSIWIFAASHIKNIGAQPQPGSNYLVQLSIYGMMRVAHFTLPWTRIISSVLIMERPSSSAGTWVVRILNIFKPSPSLIPSLAHLLIFDLTQLKFSSLSATWSTTTAGRLNSTPSLANLINSVSNLLMKFSYSSAIRSSAVGFPLFAMLKKTFLIDVIGLNHNNNIPQGFF